MPTVRSILACLLLVSVSVAQEPPAAGAGKKSEPLLVLDAGGPTSPVTAMAFTPDGNTVYAVGLDKLIRSWVLQPRTGRFHRTESTWRVPIGPGLEGSLNALGVSADGRYLAVGGKSLARGTAGFRVDGRMTPPIGGMTPDMRLDQGTIFLFDQQQNTVRALRSHTGAVLNIAFLPNRKGEPTRFVSVAQEWDAPASKFIAGLRLWDVSRETPLATQAEASAPHDRRPGLAVWSTGKAARQVRAALAWDDGQLRVWNPETDTMRTLSDGALNSGVAILPDGRLYTTTMTRNGGRLHEWQTSPEVAETPGERQTFFPPIEKQYVYPRGLALCSSAAGKPLDTAAVLLRTPTRGEQYELTLVPLNGEAAFQPTTRVPLWQGGQMPTLEAVPGGRFLAVSGAPDQAVRLIPIADLLAGKAVQPQLLRSEGTNFRYTAFATDGKQTGLVVAPSAAVKTGDRPPPVDLAKNGLLYDPAARKLIPFAAPWKLAQPNADGWQAAASRPDANQRVTITVTRNGAVQGTLQLPATAIPTDLALLPPIAPRTVPILAAGYFDENRQPILALFHGITGDKIRQLTAHQARIRQLAFSPDGRLLASVADDQTTCVWSLTDLDSVIGQRGRIDGLGVKTVNGKPEVARVETDSPAAKFLKAGDRIDGVVRAGKLAPLAGALSFYHAVDQVKPGATIMLRVIGGNDVAVPVGQGVDERKPLLTLYILEEVDGRRDWIAWNPNGPYDTGTLKAERQFGWHINPNEPGGPVIHAGAEQYRGEFRKEGIVRHLLRRGNLADALQDWDGPRVPQPKLGLGIDEPGPAAPKREGRILVRRPDLQFRAAIGNPAFPAHRVGTLEWRLDDGPWRPFTHAEDAGRTRTTALGAAPWTRGRHELAVRLRSTGNRPEEFIESLPVYYLPAEPVVVLPPAWKKAVFGDGPIRPILVQAKPLFRLEADVKPGIPGEKLRVRLQVNDAPARDMEPTVRQDIPLQKGPNRIVLTATHADTPASETAEQAVAAFEVVYAPQAPPPLVAVAPLEGDGTIPQPGRTVRVHTPRLPFSAFLTGESPLASLTFQGKPVDGFKPGQRQFLLDQTVPLQPGLQTLALVATTQAGGTAKPVWQFEYIPLLPGLVFLEPGDEADLAAGRDPAEQVLRFRVVPGVDPQAYSVAVTQNGRAPGAAKPVTAQAAELTIPVTLTGGKNRFEIQLTNAWGATTTTITELVYRRPPKVVAIPQPAIGPKPKCDLTATIETPADRPLTRVLLNNRELPATTFTQTGTANGITTWKLQVPAVPLERGPNRWTLTPVNADGPALEAGTLNLAFVPPVPPKAIIDLLDPGRDLTVEVDQYTVHFVIRSESPLEKVEIVRDDGRTVAVNVANAVAAAGGGFVLDVTQPLPLNPGSNPLRVEAVNAGGLASAPLTLTFLPPPVEVRIDRLTDERGGEFRPVLAKDGSLEIATVPRHRVKIHGRIRWAAGLPGPQGQARVRIWVNGFQQFPAELNPPADPAVRERTFAAELFLNRRHGNRIDIHLPDLPVRDRAHRVFHVRQCDEPLTRQRLHLLVVGLGSQDTQAVKTRALAAIEAEPNPERPGTLRAPGFEEVRVYGPLVGYVNRGVVNTQLRLIQHAIRVRRTVISAQPLDEVVMVYYQGAEHFDESGYFLLTDESREYRTVRRQREVGIGSDDLAAFFAQTFGAQILLLDVARTAPSPTEPPGLLGESRGLGILRTAWISPASSVNGEDRLLALMARVGPTSDTIRQLADQLGESVDKLAARYPQQALQYQAYLPIALEWLPLRGQREP